MSLIVYSITGCLHHYVDIYYTVWIFHRSDSVPITPSGKMLFYYNNI